MANPDQLQREIDRLTRDYERQREQFLRQMDVQLKAMGLDGDRLPPADPHALPEVRERFEREFFRYLPAATVRALLDPLDQVQAAFESGAADPWGADAGPSSARAEPPAASPMTASLRRRVAGARV